MEGHRTPEHKAPQISGPFGIYPVWSTGIENKKVYDSYSWPYWPAFIQFLIVYELFLSPHYVLSNNYKNNLYFIRNAFVNRTLVAQEITARIDKWDSSKFKFLHSEYTITRVRRQPVEWENIFASYASDRG
jgi:hypothetical protein